jgi:hypothetical protein
LSKKLIARSLFLAGVCLMAANMASAAGHSSRHHGAAAPGTRVKPTSAAVPNAFGPAFYTTTSVSSLGFSPFDSTWSYSFGPDDYFKYFTVSDADFGASISIPAGAVIDYIGLGSCDELGGNMAVFVYQQFADGTFNDLGSFASTAHGATTPCGTDYNTTALGYLLQANNGSSIQIDVYQVAAAPADGSVRLGSVELWWKASVSPAPASPSFLDVPADNPFFQYIEALKASGITGGCGDGTNFCPDQPVLRKQMATFLAKALGLAWQY